MNRRYNSAVGNAFSWSATSLHQLMTFCIYCGALCAFWLNHLDGQGKRKNEKMKKKRIKNESEKAAVPGLNQARLWIVGLVHVDGLLLYLHLKRF